MILSPRRPRRARLVAPPAILILLMSGLAVLGAPPDAAAATSADETAWSISPADNEMGIDRANFVYEVEPGDSFTDAVVVRNIGTAELDLAVYVADAFTTSTGQLDMLPGGQESVAAGTWAQLAADRIVFGPGEEAIVPFEVAVPADALPGDHSLGIVTSLVSAADGAQIQLDRRLGLRGHFRVAGELIPSVEVSDVNADYRDSWNPFARGALTLRYTIENTGNVRVGGEAQTTITPPLGIGALDVPAESLPEILPGSQIEWVVELSGIAPAFRIDGVSTVSTIGVGVRGATVELTPVSFGVWAVPWALLILLAIVAIAAIVTVLLVRRRTRRGGESETAAIEPEHELEPIADDARL